MVPPRPRHNVPPLGYARLLTVHICLLFPHLVKFLANRMQFNTSCKDYDSINQHSHQSTRTTGAQRGRGANHDHAQGGGGATLEHIYIYIYIYILFLYNLYVYVIIWKKQSKKSFQKELPRSIGSPSQRQDPRARRALEALGLRAASPAALIDFNWLVSPLLPRSWPLLRSSSASKARGFTSTCGSKASRGLPPQCSWAFLEEKAAESPLRSASPHVLSSFVHIAWRGRTSSLGLHVIQ